MEFFKALEVRDRIATPVLMRLKSDMKKAPASARQFLAHLEPYLFDPEFRLSDAYAVLALDPDALRQEFTVTFGTSPQGYLRTLRLTVAKRLLTSIPDLKIGVISDLVGYASSKTLGHAFNRHLNMSPSTYRKRHGAAGGEFTPDFLRRLNTKCLDATDIKALVAYLRTQHPEALEEGRPLRLMIAGYDLVDGRGISVEELEELNARILWSEIRDLPQDVQEQRIAHASPGFRTPALFEFLREESIEVGRKHRPMGVQVAELALFAAMRFELPDRTTGKSALWARGWANLANARRLALDLDGAILAFEKAEHYLPPQPDAAILGKILDLKAMLRWYQRDYAEGLELENRAIALLSTTDDKLAFATALIDQAILFHCIGDLESGVKTLSRVLPLLPELNDVAVDLSTYYTLAQYYRKLGNYEATRQNLNMVRQLSIHHNSQTYDAHIDWFEGRLALDLHDLNTAERFLASARSSFSLVEAKGFAALASLDLAIAEQGKDRESLDICRDIIIVFELWRSNPELEKFWRKLKRTIFTQTVSAALLIEIRSATDRFQEDPLNSKHLDCSLREFPHTFQPTRQFA